MLECRQRSADLGLVGNVRKRYIIQSEGQSFKIFAESETNCRYPAVFQSRRTGDQKSTVQAL